MNRMHVVLWVAAAFAVGAFVGSVGTQWMHAVEPLTPPATASTSSSAPASEVRHDPVELTELQPERVAVAVAPQEERSSGAEPAKPSARAAPRSPRGGKLFDDLSAYEESEEFNPKGRKLTKEERQELQSQLEKLEMRRSMAEMALTQDAMRVIDELHKSGAGVRPVAPGEKVTGPSGALFTDLRTTQEGTFTVSVFEQDLPSYSQYRTEVDTLREQGLSLMSDFFQRP